MSDDDGIRTSYSSSRARSRKKRSSGGDGSRSYARGGAAGERKSDNPAAWSRTPESRAGADRRSKW